MTSVTFSVSSAGYYDTSYYPINLEGCITRNQFQESLNRLNAVYIARNVAIKRSTNLTQWLVVAIVFVCTLYALDDQSSIGRKYLLLYATLGGILIHCLYYLYMLERHGALFERAVQLENEIYYADNDPRLIWRLTAIKPMWTPGYNDAAVFSLSIDVAPIARGV